MLDKLSIIEEKYNQLSDRIADPEVIANNVEWTKLVKEHSSMEQLVITYREYKETKKSFEELNELAEVETDKELREMVQEEMETLSRQIESFTQKLRIMLLPKDPNDEKSVVIEIRGGAGGDEAALFGADLYRMYTRYAERNRWKNEILSASYNDIGGIKELIFVIEGQGAYSRLKYESGVHRVQRIPSTESGGRIHTSTATVAVLPEAEDVEVEINMNDLRIDVFRSSGNGGQSVNTTDSAVRITHLPTGMVVTCQDEKSQLKNKDKALRVLKARLLENAQSEKEQEYAQERRSQVGTGDRSERIRTYNFPQGRITDHRIGLTVHRLETFLDGEIDEMIDALTAEDQARKLELSNA